MPARHKVKFSPTDSRDLGQNEVHFLLEEDGRDRRIRFHDYDEIYRRPGLYEQIFYDRLKCASPRKVGENLRSALDAVREYFNELRVLDLGAGNGIVGDVMRAYGAARVVGVDITPAAKRAANRDRPGIYDDYYITDLAAIDESIRQELDDWSFNCLVSVAALGFDDIPVAAFAEAINLVQDGGWIAFNIKETFLDVADQSGFSNFIRQLIFSEYLDLHHLERYQHRLSIDGAPLFYFSLVARKLGQIPGDMAREWASA